jgi:hypothetical protein
MGADGLFLLHELAANSMHLSERKIHLLVVMFHNSIITPNTSGLLPFHYACLDPGNYRPRN